MFDSYLLIGEIEVEVDLFEAGGLFHEAMKVGSDSLRSGRWYKALWLDSHEGWRVDYRPYRGAEVREAFLGVGDASRAEVGIVAFDVAGLERAESEADPIPAKLTLPDVA